MLSKLFQKIILSLVLALLVAALWFSFQSPVLSIDQLSSKFIDISVVGVFAVAFWLIFRKWTPSKEAEKAEKTEKEENEKSRKSKAKPQKQPKLKLIFWVVFAILIVYQLVLIFQLKAQPMWDAAFVENFPPKGDPTLSLYLSMFPNNQLIFFFNYKLYRLFLPLFGAATFPTFFMLLNVVFVSSSLILLRSLADKLFKSELIGLVAALLFAFYAIIQPIFLVPYTDTYGLPFLLASLLLLLLASETKKMALRLGYGFLSGLLTAIAYLFRPSFLVPFIALLIFLLVTAARNKEVLRKALFIGPLYIIGLVLVLFSFQFYVAHQSYVKIDKTKTEPWTYMLLLGSYGNENDYNALHGTYNGADVAFSLKSATVSVREKATFSAFLARTEKRGLSGTVKFYIQKLRDVTDTGVIEYHREGLWIMPLGGPSTTWADQISQKYFAPQGTLSNFLQQIYFQTGKLRATFNYICQLVWLPTLAFAIYGLWKRRESKRILLIALTVLGGLLFLELFESGGTRYLFQYLPFICLLSAVGVDEWLRKLRGK